MVGTLANRLLVYFGYPVATDSDAARALKAAVEIKKRFDPTPGQPQAGVRIGLHSGLTVMGVEAVSTGVTSSIAMRLENIAPTGEILVSSTVQRRLANTIDFEPFAADEREAVGLRWAATATWTRRRMVRTTRPRAPSVDRPMVGRRALDAMSEAWTSARRAEGSLFWSPARPVLASRAWSGRCGSE